jgi:hypothetical protein
MQPPSTATTAQIDPKPANIFVVIFMGASSSGCKIAWARTLKNPFVLSLSSTRIHRKNPEKPAPQTPRSNAIRRARIGSNFASGYSRLSGKGTKPISALMPNGLRKASDFVRF